MKCLLRSFGLLVLLALAAPAATPPPEKILAADTLAVLTFPDYGKTRGILANWPSSLLLKDPSMKPFVDKFSKKFTSDVIAPLEKEFGLKIADYHGLAQGQITLALTRGGWDGANEESPGFLLLVDTKDKSEVLKTNLTELKKKWVDSGKQIRGEKIRDIDFTTMIFNSDDLGKTLDKIFPDPNAGNETLDAPKPKKPGKKLEWLLGQSGSLMILGSHVKDIEKVLISQSGGAVPSLAEQGTFTSSYNSQFRDAQAYGWINLKTIVDALSKQFSKGGGGGEGGFPRPDKILSALGLTGLQTLTFNMRDTGEGALVNFNVNIPESQRRGLFKVLTFDTKDSAPPPFVGADIVKFSRWRLDLRNAYNTLESTLIEAMPQMAGVIKMVVDNAGKDKDPDFDLRKQLIGNLGDDVITFAKAPRKQTIADLQSPPTLTLIQSPKPEQLAGSFRALTSVMPMQGKVKEREFLGRKVYSMTLPPTPAPGGGKAIEKTLSYTASGGFVAISTDVAMLEEFMRNTDGPGKTLREAPGLADAAQKIGGMSTGLFGYENQAETMRSAVETLKKESGTLANLFSGSPLAGRLGMAEDSNKFKDWVDFSLLPSFDKIAKYFYISVWSGTVTADGINFRLYAPNPPQMKK